MTKSFDGSVEQWAEIDAARNSRKAPVRVFEEPDLIERTVRDFLTEEVDEVLCDDEETVDRMKGIVGAISRRAKTGWRPRACWPPFGPTSLSVAS